MSQPAPAKRCPRGIIATACLPWEEDYRLDEQSFRRQVRHLAAGGAGRIYLFGTAGEGYALTDARFREVVGIFAAEMSPSGSAAMVGIIGTALEQMQERIGMARELGIREFQISLPCWGALSDRELMAFFHALCDPHPDCLFMHYNVRRSGRLLGVREYLALAGEIPNLAAAKITGLDAAAIRELVAAPCPIQFFLCDLAYGQGSPAGECGYLAALTAVNLRVARAYYEAGLRGDRETLRSIDGEIGAVLKRILELVPAGSMDGVYDKLCAKMAVPGFPLRLLPPYESVGEDVFAAFRRFFEESLPGWLQR